MTTLRPLSLSVRRALADSVWGTVESLAETVFAAVAADVPFAFACLATIDPASELITGAFKSQPLSIGDEEFAAAEYGRPDTNQFADIARRAVPVGVLSLDTNGDPHSCRRFRDLMAPRFGFTDELRVVCRAQGATWGALALYRGAGEPPFTSRDGRTVAAVGPVIADGIQRTLFAATSPPRQTTPAAVIIVDAADRVTDVTAAAAGQIDELGGWDNGSLPSNVLAVTALARASGQPAQTRVLSRSGTWLALQAMALDGDSPRSVVVSIAAAAPVAVGQLALAAHGLTAREQQVAQQVLQGAPTKAIAAALSLSPHTVQDHLKAVFRKLGVANRRELIAQLTLPDDQATGPAACADEPSGRRLKRLGSND